MSVLYMLDTDSVSYALRGVGRVAENIVRRRPSEICISAITLAELRYGAARRKSKRLNDLIDSFTSNIEVMSFDEDAATEFGGIAAALAEKGIPIGTADVYIAAHALASGAVLVTNNTKHFSRVKALQVENWT